ncbi:hypothetical protein QBC46DRAFT_461014 [Diplogelasinospora grovesii]|uniref:Zn(2)-C6 fungal-type domain-containing protein n=1 Tax=Diplogelasinospora grovesii TaxID=303347 RepID=A0AAN6N145_9PEZI|nr:hypothetical protein QBC46DRAFT_461014 [Diplogelasinospora grovesii]
MVYYGVLSKGCERCRQRKIKCDQQRPGCRRCEKSSAQCPGYRDLNEVLFRDESKRIILMSRQTEQSIEESSIKPPICPTSKDSKPLAPSPFPSSISYPLSQPANELGANFFFARYTGPLNEAPFSSDFVDWLTQSYLFENTLSSRVLKAAIEAVGMAGISNTSHAPDVFSRSRARYCEALAAMNQALHDPDQAISDATLMAITLCGFFETATFESWDRYRRHWTAHVQAATSLLELRGPAQFASERGGQLYLVARSQILSACYQQHIPVPPGLVRTTFIFQCSTMRQQWQQRRVASPGSTCEISFRIVNLQAALNSTHSDFICTKAVEIDGDLEAWRDGVLRLPSWQYCATITSVDDGAGFDGKRHIYPNLWVAEAWNSWRTLRILVNQIIVRSTSSEDSGYSPVILSRVIEVIRQLSTDLCISACALAGTSRVISLIEPLCIVASEELNARSVRSFAAEQLHRIDREMGIRQAGAMARQICI